MDYIRDAIQRAHLCGDGYYTKKCHELLAERTGAGKVLLVHSGTAALEMAALLIDCRPGDEIIMPSYTFVSTANAFVLRGGVPVFVDIRPDTQNIDETLIEAAITDRTRAICVVHYAGVASVPATEGVGSALSAIWAVTVSTRPRMSFPEREEPCW